MGKTKPPYPAEFKRQIIDLVNATLISGSTFGLVLISQTIPLIYGNLEYGLLKVISISGLIVVLSFSALAWRRLDISWRSQILAVVLVELGSVTILARWFFV